MEFKMNQKIKFKHNFELLEKERQLKPRLNKEKVTPKKFVRIVPNKEE